MRFTYAEEVISDPMPLGDILRAMNMIEALNMPLPVSNRMKELLRRLKHSCESVPSVAVGLASMDDGRKYWTITAHTEEHTSNVSRRTFVYNSLGKRVNRGSCGGKRAVHEMEARLEAKIIRDVMKS